MSRFENKVVLVTGGATGIGKAISEALVREGASVVVAARRQEVLKEFAAKHAGKVLTARLDVSAAGDARRVVGEVVEHFGRIDAVINNAGTGILGPLAEMSDEQLSQLYAVNVTGLLALVREALPHLIESGGNVVNISSTLAQGVAPGAAAYAGTKAAVEHATRNLAVELGPQGVRVNAVAPGFTHTDMAAPLLEDEESHQAFVAQTPMGRVGRPEDIAPAVLFLASDEAGWITGQALQVSGGLML